MKNIRNGEECATKSKKIQINNHFFVHSFIFASSFFPPSAHSFHTQEEKELLSPHLMNINPIFGFYALTLKRTFNIYICELYYHKLPNDTILLLT